MNEIKPQLEQIFQDRSRSIYNSMTSRARKRMLELPFTLVEFRAWLLGQFGPSGWEGVVACAYCQAWLNVQTVSVDHVEPVAPPWNGSFALANLTCACARCNQMKNKMSGDGFRKLVAWIRAELDPRDAGDVLGRLATGALGAKMMWQQRRQAKKDNF